MTTTELTNQYIERHQAVKQCLKDGLINYSSLARKIVKDLHIEKSSSKEAILIAARRYSEKIKPERIRENEIRTLLSQSELEIKNKIVVIIIEKNEYYKKRKELQKQNSVDQNNVQVIEGANHVTLITTEKYHDGIKKLFNGIVKTNKELVQITLKSPATIEKTPGVLSYILFLFAENEVNIYEVMSCWIDTILLISEKDIGKTMGFLRIN